MAAERTAPVGQRVAERRFELRFIEVGRRARLQLTFDVLDLALATTQSVHERGGVTASGNCISNAVQRLLELGPFRRERAPTHDQLIADGLISSRASRNARLTTSGCITAVQPDTARTCALGALLLRMRRVLRCTGRRVPCGPRVQLDRHRNPSARRAGRTAYGLPASPFASWSKLQGLGIG